MTQNQNYFHAKIPIIKKNKKKKNPFALIPTKSIQAILFLHDHAPKCSTNPHFQSCLVLFANL